MLTTAGNRAAILDPHPSSPAARFRDVREQSVQLAAPLSPEDQGAQSMPDASPTKWHLAHTTWFFETFLLAPHAPGYRLFDPRFGFLFNSYYEAIGPRHERPKRGLLTRPSLEEIDAYRRHVDAHLLALLLHDEGRARALAPLLELGLNHEQQHQELLLTDVKHLFAQSPLRPSYLPREPRPVALPTEGGWVSFEGGLTEIGHQGSSFAFDHEGPRHRVFLNPFALASRPITNHEYLAFIADCGYLRPELWLSDGWAFVQQERLGAPLYWERSEGAWWCFTLGGLAPLDPCEPVAHLSFFEADAFARWAGARLPTEAEWEIAARDIAIARNLLERGRLHPGAAPRGDGGPLQQLFGDVWEWTASPYTPYPGYRPAPGALGEYNGKFMSGQLVLRGGSALTPRSHLRATYRNFFAPTARWQLTGLRLARDA